jgi:hypothetical protein
VYELQVKKRDPRLARVVDVKPPPLTDGAARLELDFIALTSNNMTYAVMGEGFGGYWGFFPGPEDWGKPPAWGFATVIASKAQGIAEGARYYGFFPISETLDVIPNQASARGFVDGAAHRACKAAVYNHYADTRADPAYDASFELEQALPPCIRQPGGLPIAPPQRDIPCPGSVETILFLSAKLLSRFDA